MVDDGRTDDGRTDDGRTPDHGHPISSPCEPNGSGELITLTSVFLCVVLGRWQRMEVTLEHESETRFFFFEKNVDEA